jgi:hypothetical protein
MQQATLEELNSILDRTENLVFKGKESFTRLRCLNQLAHLAIYHSLDAIDSDQEEPYLNHNAIRFVDRFMVNEALLGSSDKLAGENLKTAFEKVRKQMVEDIRYFVKRASASPHLQKMTIYR